MKGKIKGRKKQKLHLWRKNGIQEMVTQKAHRNLIRVSRVCAWNTSRLAFDGSEPVIRGRINLTEDEVKEFSTLVNAKKQLPGKNQSRKETFTSKELCTFQNGKQYNCDLSASYNIGARYFPREYCKADPSLIDVLPCSIQRTYSDLRKLIMRLTTLSEDQVGCRSGSRKVSQAG